MIFFFNYYGIAAVMFGFLFGVILNDTGVISSEDNQLSLYLWFGFVIFFDCVTRLILYFKSKIVEGQESNILDSIIGLKRGGQIMFIPAWIVGSGFCMFVLFVGAAA